MIDLDSVLFLLSFDGGPPDRIWIGSEGEEEDNEKERRWLENQEKLTTLTSSLEATQPQADIDVRLSQISARPHLHHLRDG
jgi:hypothetical protein